MTNPSDPTPMRTSTGSASDVRSSRDASAIDTRWRAPWRGIALAVVAVVVGGAACGSSGSGPGSDGGAGTGSGTTGADGAGPSGANDGGGGPGSGLLASGDDAAPQSGSVAIAPPDSTVMVTITDGVVTAPTVAYTATINGQAATAAWSVDQGGVAAIDSTGVLTPTGTAGGTINVTATVGSSHASTSLTVVIQRTQNGFTGPIDLTGAGGYGGVGGEGPGGAVSGATAAALQQPPAHDARAFVYPYDKTVWPRGLLAPLLQWTAPGTGVSDATAIGIHLQSKTFTYDGTFGRPAALAATAPFVRHPIPQDVWQQATESTAGTDTLAVSVVLLAGGSAVGPMTETWRVAPGILEGTVYYQSYGTLLVQNSDFTAQDGSHVGAAVLSIKPGDLAPRVAAGVSSPTANGATQWGTGCRACHTVAAKGGSLIVQDNVYPYDVTSQYDLQTSAETMISTNGALDWAGLSPDGTIALSSSVNMGTDADTQTGFYTVTGGAATPMAVSGLPTGITAATPVFSPDGSHVAFTHVAGKLGSLTGDGTHVVALDFDRAAPAVANPRSVFVSPAGASDCVGVPSFFPTNDSLLVQVELSACYSSTFKPFLGTSNVNAEIWWSDTATGTQHRLDTLDGLDPDGSSYLPVGPNGHGADATLNYEPTVNPASSGGYAWVIFTSRRMYGSVATIAPFSSDPRSYDYAHQVTTKKLWVAALDLNAPPGTDPSHPAFYLPAQELQAGNARGYWVLDPCKADGATCQSGDQCCGGYCQPLGANGALVCGNQAPSCAQDGDKCVQAADCCNGLSQCIGGFCAPPTPPQ